MCRVPGTPHLDSEMWESDEAASHLRLGARPGRLHRLLVINAIEKVSLKGFSRATIILLPAMKVMERCQCIAEVLDKDPRHIKRRSNEADMMLPCVSE